jgi:carboxymethylenebutenolidase
MSAMGRKQTLDGSKADGNATRSAQQAYSQLALLEAERAHSIRAVIAFGPAAASWEGSPLLQHRLIHAARTIDAPVLIIHAANDYSTQPGRVLDSERARLGKPHQLKIYPPYGRTAAEGHSFLYLKPTIWEADVFRFLDQSLGM